MEEFDIFRMDFTIEHNIFLIFLNSFICGRNGFQIENIHDIFRWKKHKRLLRFTRNQAKNVLKHKKKQINDKSSI